MAKGHIRCDPGTIGKHTKKAREWGRSWMLGLSDKEAIGIEVDQRAQGNHRHGIGDASSIGDVSMWRIAIVRWDGIFVERARHICAVQIKVILSRDIERNKREDHIPVRR